MGSTHLRGVTQRTHLVPLEQRADSYRTLTSQVAPLTGTPGWSSIQGPLAAGFQPHPINSVQSQDSEGLPEVVSYQRFAVCDSIWSMEASGSVQR